MKKAILFFVIIAASCTKGPLMQVQQARNSGNFFNHFSTRVVIDSQLVTDGTHFYFGTRHGKLFSVRTKNLHRSWTHSFDASVDTSVLVDESRVIVGTGDGFLHALDKKNGKQIWEVFLSAPPRGIITKVGAILAVGTNEGVLFAIDPTDGHTLWKYRHEPYEKMKIQFFVQGSSQENKLFVGFPNGQIAALDIQTGNELWKQRITDPQARFYDIASMILVPGQGILVSAVDGSSSLFSFNGQQLWSIGDTSTAASPMINDHQIYLAAKNKIMILNEDGTDKAAMDYAKSIRPAGIALDESNIYVTTLDGSLVVFDQKTAAWIWEYHMGISIQGAPIILNGHIYVLNRNGQIIEMSPRK